MIRAFRSLAPSIAVLLLIPAAVSGQGIRMAPDFLPLGVGNQWRYEIADENGQISGSLDIRINDFTIVEGSSYYVFSQFPLAPDLGANQQVGIRYDNQNRQFVWFDGQRQSDLFPSLGASAEVVETDDNGQPFRARFDFGELSLVLERGLGIVEARFQSFGAPQVATLTGARVAGETIGGLEALEPAPRAARAEIEVADPEDNVAGADARPELAVEVQPAGDGHRFVLRARNPTDKLMAFDFDSSQSFDFVVTDPDSGEEVWRWAERKFFSQVIRSEAIRAGGEWVFDGEWNHRDKDLDEVGPGTYAVTGILAADDPVESEPVRFEVE